MIGQKTDAKICPHCGIVVMSLNRISHDFGTLCPGSRKAKGLPERLNKLLAGFIKPAKP